MLLESKLTGSHQMNMMNDIRMSYSMLMELEQLEQVQNASKTVSPEPAAVDSPKAK